MSKFMIECPKCHRYNEASNGLFARRNFQCSCGNIINVKNDKIVTRECPECGNTVIYDQSKGTKAKCPICGAQLVSDGDYKQMVHIPCRTCGCLLQVSKTAVSIRCPLCGADNDVQEAVKKEQIREKGEPVVIEYRGDSKTLVWRHPMTEFVLGSQLIVRESQEAIFLRNGEALDSFGPGRHELETPILPKMSSKVDMSMSGVPFRAEVYFVNLTTQFDLRWGTPSRVNIMDPETEIRLPIGASGGFSLRVTQPRKLLSRVVGTQKDLKLEQLFDLTSGSFRMQVLGKITARLGEAIQNLNICVLDISQYLNELSEVIRRGVNEDLEEYGVEMPDFTVINIVYPENDEDYQTLKNYYNTRTRKRRELESDIALEQMNIRMAEAKAMQEAAKIRILNEAKTDAERRQGLTEAEIMKAKGYSYQDETARQVATQAAQNGGGSGSSGIAAEVMQMTAGVEAARQVAEMTKAAFSGKPAEPAAAPAAPAAGWDCACGRRGNTGAFCPDCGQRRPSAAASWICPECGQRDLTSRFCPNCGARRPSDDTWTCGCGQTGITSKFCPNCGSKRP